MDNTVGSLTQLQRSVVIGSLLGDGYLRILPGRTDAFLEINHSIHAKEYVDWKFEILRNICLSPPKSRRGNGKRIAYRFFTRQHPELSKFHRMFYREGVKIIPTQLVLDPMAIAIWFMDDGGRSGESNFYLNTQKFALEEQNFLIEKLREKGLESTLNKDKSYYRIRFLSSSIRKLKELLEGNIIPSMRYKLPKVWLTQLPKR